MIVDATDEEIDVYLERVASDVHNLKRHLGYLKKRVYDAEKVIHTIGFSSGRLDVCGGNAEQLLNLCKEVKTQLEEDANSYWNEYGDSPLCE